MIIVAIILIGVVILCDWVLIILFRFDFKEYPLKQNGQYPDVSILLAVKDEEKNINRCLDSLLSLSYPRDRLEILIGNDASTDNTLSIAKQYASQYEHVKVYDISESIGQQKGKANVLGQLAHKAKGAYFFFTDADMSLPTYWIQYMLSPLKRGMGLAIGVTQVQGSNMQHIDWLAALGLVKVITDLGYPVTGVGNNMVVSKEAYRSVGGYEALPFSIVEDFELFRQIASKGYRCVHVFSDNVLGTTRSVTGLGNLLNQRKRWMKGATQLSGFMLTLLALQPMIYFAIGGLTFMQPVASIILLFSKLFSKIFLLFSIQKRLKIRVEFINIVLFEFYNVFFTFLVLIYYLLPTKVTWKGREY